MIYLSANNGTVAVSEEGRKLWQFDAPPLLNVSPVVTADRTVYLAPWRDLIAFGPDGRQLWRLTLDNTISASPSVGGNGVIYATEGGILHALVSTNELSPLAKSPWPMFHANPRHTGRVNLD